MIRQVLTCAGLVIAANAVPQSAVLDTPPTNGYVVHLATPHLPTIQLLELTTGDTRFVNGPHPFPISQERNLPITPKLSPAGIASSRAAIRIRVSGPSGRAEQTYWLSTKGWNTGGTYTWNGVYRVPTLAVAGHATLTIVQLLPEEPDAIPLGNGTEIPVREAILFRGPVYIQPAATTSRVRQETVDTTFGPEGRRLGRAFRLAPNTSIQINVDLLPGEHCVGVGVVSSLGGGFDFEQGSVVVSITPDSSQESLHVRAGVDTSFIDSATPPPGVVRVESVRAIAHHAAPYADWHDAPAEAAIYASSLRFREPQDLNTLTFQYSAAHGYIDVHDIVCLLRRSTPAP